MIGPQGSRAAGPQGRRAEGQMYSRIAVQEDNVKLPKIDYVI